jgi:Protein of unknown function (DUF2997)
MTMETLEFVIYPDGRVQETVTGIVGNSCAQVTAEIEAVLGRVVAHQPTAEFFEQENTQAVTDTNTNFTTW